MTIDPGHRPILVDAERSLVIVREFAAPRELVFAAWTDPRHAMQWWGPRHHPARLVDMDVRPGGRWRHCLRSVETGEDLWHSGVYREVAPPERLVFTFRWETEGERGLDTVVTVTFESKGRGTRMTLRQTPFQFADERDGHGEGWNSTFDRLADFLGGGPA